MPTVRTVTIAAVIVALQPAPSHADPGKPVAVRWWGGGMSTVETYWNLCVVIDPSDEATADASPTGKFDLAIASQPDRATTGALSGNPLVIGGGDSAGSGSSPSLVLDRLPNQDQPAVLPAESGAIHSTHEIYVTAVVPGGQREGSPQDPPSWFLIEVDGVRLLHVADASGAESGEEQLEELGRIDVLLIAAGKATDGIKSAREIAGQLKPRYIVPIGDVESRIPDQMLSTTFPNADVRRAIGNTLAVSAPTDAAAPTLPTVVWLESEPWRPSEELAELLVGVRAANRASQEAFKPLSANQMNFRPANGTHTPRWNVEHMMGRELQFFTQVYAALDPEISVIDLNPEQMPEDYEPANPHWTGAEEARQMERASALVRRFAYLLAGLDLGRALPGSGWRLRGLCEQMERHYAEHTANVRAKFDLPDWPAE